MTDISEDPTRGSEALNSINSYLGNNIVSIVFQYGEGLFCPQVGTFLDLIDISLPTRGKLIYPKFQLFVKSPPFAPHTPSPSRGVYIDRCVKTYVISRPTTSVECLIKVSNISVTFNFQ